MKYVTYWYQFFTGCEELVPICHGVKLAKCEICGSTMLHSKSSVQILTFFENSLKGKFTLFLNIFIIELTVW